MKSNAMGNGGEPWFRPIPRPQGDGSMPQSSSAKKIPHSANDDARGPDGVTQGAAAERRLRMALSNSQHEADRSALKKALGAILRRGSRKLLTEGRQATIEDRVLEQGRALQESGSRNLPAAIAAVNRLITVDIPRVYLTEALEVLLTSEMSTFVQEHEKEEADVFLQILQQDASVDIETIIKVAAFLDFIKRDLERRLYAAFEDVMLPLGFENPEVLPIYEMSADHYFQLKRQRDSDHSPELERLKRNNASDDEIDSCWSRHQAEQVLLAVQLGLRQLSEARKLAAAGGHW